MVNKGMAVLLLLAVCFASMHNIESIPILSKSVSEKIDLHEPSHLDYSEPFLAILKKDDGHPYLKFYFRPFD